MNITELLGERCRTNNRRIVFPEGESREIVKAAHVAFEVGICRPILLGDADTICEVCKQCGVPQTHWYTLIDPQAADMDEDLRQLHGNTDLDDDTLRFLLDQPLYYAAMLLKTGHADAMVAGFIAETTEVISAGMLLVGLGEGISAPSSFFIMDIPGFSGSEGSLLVYADAGVNIDPTTQELAEIAVLTAHNTALLLGWEPRVAMLSFSTKGSASHETADKVIDALALAREKAPDLLIDGELQADAALSPRVAEKKVPGGSPVAGRANVLVFPDLGAGNIAYKLTQRLSGGQAYGPILQGFAQPICDLSRGSSVEDILGIICVAGVL